MKSLLFFLVMFLVPATALAEKTSFDLVRFSPPAPWKKTAWKKVAHEKASLGYTMTDKQAGTYCQIFVLRSIESKGDILADFNSDWKGVVEKSYAVTAAPQMTDTLSEDGWDVKAGVASFAFDKGTSIAMLTTISGHGRAVSIVAVTNSEVYVPAIQALLGSVEANKAALTAYTAKPAAKAAAAKPAALQGYMEYNPFTKSWTWKVRYPPPSK